MDFQTILYRKQAGIARITLNRPEALNTFNIMMRDEMYQVLSAVRDDPEANVLLLNGAGDRAFCAGADLTEFLTTPSPAVARQVRWERDVWGLFLSLPQPTIAALHGYVLGSGIEMALCCDLRIAAEGSRFGLPEVGLGIIPVAGATQTLPRATGPGMAKEMLTANRWLDAREAWDVGLVNRVVPTAELQPAAEAMAGRILAHPHTAIRLAKAAVVRGLDLSLPEGLELEGRLAKVILASGKQPVTGTYKQEVK